MINVIVLFVSLAAALVFAHPSVSAQTLCPLEINYRALFEGHGSIMLTIEADSGRIVFANEAARDFYGYKSLEGMTIQQINTLTPEEVERERMAAAREERNYYIFRHRLSNGETRIVEVFSYPYAAAGETLLFSIIHDKTDAYLLAERTDKYTTAMLYLTLLFLIILTAFSMYLYKSLRKSRMERLRILASERKNATLISNIHGMVYRCKYDDYWTMEYVSQGAVSLTGYRPDELINNAAIDFNSIIDEEYRQILRDRWEELKNKDHEIFEHEYTIITKDGIKKWVMERGQIIYTDSGDIEAIEGVITDINDVKSKERQAHEYREKLQATLLSVGDGVIATDIDEKIELMNPVAERLTGWSYDHARGESFEKVFRIVDENSREKVPNPVSQALRKKTVVELANHALLIARDGKEYLIEDTAAPIWNTARDITGCVIIFRDNTEKYKKNKEIEYISFHDYLTGLHNRRYFEEELKRLDNSRNLPLSVLIMDINGLKITNDAFGHDVGDELIKTVAATLKNLCRKNDIVARYGGDEFIVLLLNADGTVAEEIAGRISSTLKKEKIMDIEVSVSIGSETKFQNSESIIETVKSAEDKMYRKKAVEHLSKGYTTVKSIMNILMVKSPEEEAHSKRVAMLCEKLGTACGLNDKQVKRLKVAGEMHDIGKITVAEEILHKIAALTDDEWMQIKKHPVTGSRILSSAVEFSDIAEIILCHHERWDGSGYPRGLKGEKIPVEARIIAVADAFDAMTSVRAYRGAFTKDQAIRELEKNMGAMFDRKIVQAFVDIVLPEEETL